MFDLVKSTICAPAVHSLLLVGSMAPAGSATLDHVRTNPYRSDYGTFIDSRANDVQESGALAVNLLSTHPMHHELDFRAEVAGSAMAAEAGDNVARGSWLSQLDRGEAWLVAERSLVDIAALEDNWCGPGSVAATDEALRGAAALLAELERELPEEAAPSISMDSDGFPVFCWQSNGVYGSLSVFDQEYYAFYVERDGRQFESGEARLTEALPNQLLEVLRG